MRLAFVADLHVGNHRLHGGPLEAGINRRCRLVVAALEAASRLAREEGCSHLVACGDVFDTARPEPQVLAAVQEVLRAKGPMPTEPRAVLVKGNHDIVTAAPGDHALGPLLPVARVPEEPCALPLGDGPDAPRLWVVPFQPGDAAAWFPEALERLGREDRSQGQRVLAFHLGVRDERTPPWLAEARDAVGVRELGALMERHRVRWAFAGNWHEPRRWALAEGGAAGTLHVVQVGCLAPTGWDNPGLGYGTMAVLDTDDRNAQPRLLRVPGPRFVSTAAEAVEAAAQGCTPYVRLKGGGGEGEAEAAAKAGAAAVEVGPADASEAQAALRTAAALARSAGSLDEALAAYVGQLQLEDASMRPEVLERCRAFLSGGAP